MEGNVPYQAVLLFPAAIKPRLSTLGEERPAQHPPGEHNTREAPPAHHVPSWKSCKPTLNSSNQTPLTAHETTRLATVLRTTSPSCCSVIHCSDYLQKAPAEEPRGWGTAVSSGSCSQILAEDRWQCLTLH